MIKRNILLTPGPATTKDSVKEAQVVSDICPREKEFGQIMEKIKNDLVKIAGGNQDYACVLFGGSGTAVMDAVINSVVAPGKKILIINNGAYGERMVKIAQTYNIGFIELKFRWDSLPDLNLVEENLKNNQDIGYLAFIHHETTTGLLNPLKELTLLAKRYNCVTIVDTISSFAGLPINMIEDEIDFMMSTSNKCIQGMAGISFVICKINELEKIKDYPRRSFYLDLYSQYDYLEKKKQTQFTPPVQTIYALEQAIREFFEEGAENRFKRYEENWQTLYRGLENLGFKFLIPRENQAKLLITVFEPEIANFDFDKLHDLLFEKGFTIYPGKLDDQRKTFRLANLGAIDKNDILNFLKALQQTLQEINIGGNND